MYFLVFEIKLFQEKISSDTLQESKIRIAKIKTIRNFLLTIFIVTSAFKVHTDSLRICGYLYCAESHQFEYNSPLEIIEAVSLSILTLLNAFMVVYFWHSFRYFVTLKTNLALSNNKEAFSVFSRFILFGLQASLVFRFLINLTLNPLTVVMILTDLSEA